MAKVYIVTRGCYSDYGIECVFSTLEAAEKYCATTYSTGYRDEPRIEEYDLEDGSNILCPTIYRAIDFNSRYESIYYSIKYSNTPFALDIHSIRDQIVGIIPITKRIENDDEIKKIIRDHIAMWRAKQYCI